MVLVRIRESWLRYTLSKAYAKAEKDRLLFGTGFMARRWWGWGYAPTETIIRITKNNHAATLAELEHFGVKKWT